MYQDRDDYPEYEHYDDYPDYDEDKEEVIDFGCACVNPIVVDHVCAGCISWFEEQSRIRTSKLSVVEHDGHCICDKPIGPICWDEIPF